MRKIVHYNHIYTCAKFGNFWNHVSTIFILYKLEAIGYLENLSQWKKRFTVPSPVWTVLPSTFLLAHWPPTISLPDAYSGQRPPDPAGPSSRIDSNAPRQRAQHEANGAPPSGFDPIAVPSHGLLTTPPFHRVPLHRSHMPRDLIPSFAARRRKLSPPRFSPPPCSALSPCAVVAPRSHAVTPRPCAAISELSRREELPQNHLSHHAAKHFLHRDDRTSVSPL
jgi:hypothetical protein